MLKYGRDSEVESSQDLMFDQNWHKYDISKLLFGKSTQHLGPLCLWQCFALERLKNHKVPHLHPNSTMFMLLYRLQLKTYAFSGKLNVCSKRVLLLWIKICRDFTLKTQIFTQKYRSWLIFYSEFLRKNLAGGGSATELKEAFSVECKQCIYPIDWIEAQKVKNPLHTGLALTDRPVLCTYKSCTGNQTSLRKFKLINETSCNLTSIKQRLKVTKLW